MAHDHPRQIEAPGVTLNALERNPEGSPSVLFLHGWLDHAHSHDWLRDALPESWRTVAMDFRGHGRSGHVPGGLYHLTDYLADVDFAIEALNLGAVHLVGHSLGGTVALLYAGARPERVRSVTSIESLGPSGGDAQERTLPRLRQFVMDLHKPSRKRVYASVEEAAHRLRANNTGLSERAAQHFAKHGTRPVEGGVEFTFDPAHRRMFGTSVDEQQTLAIFRGVESPVQVIHGTHGFSFDDQQMQQRLEALRARPPVAVEGGHHVHMDQPDQVAKLIANFIGARERDEAS